MKSALFTGAMLLLACQSEALKCFTCVASNEEECNKQGSQPCPQYADGCSIITAPNSMIKSCSYQAFCDRSQLASGGVSMDCCFTDDGNGPVKGSSASTDNNSGTSILYNPTVLLLY